jgi:hypothetical protein
MPNLLSGVEHAWTESENGTAHCPKCGSVRVKDGSILRQTGAICLPPCNNRREVDGVIVDGPES